MTKRDEWIRVRSENAVSPPVDYVETAPESFCPPPGWVAPDVPETWAARLGKGFRFVKGGEQ